VGGHVVDVTPADGVSFNDGVTCWIYVGVAGDLSITTESGVTSILPNVPAGAVLRPLRVTGINATGTTASGIRAFF
jgi:hypothetical protein